MAGLIDEPVREDQLLIGLQPLDVDDDVHEETTDAKQISYRRVLRSKLNLYVSRVQSMLSLVAQKCTIFVRKNINAIFKCSAIYMKDQFGSKYSTRNAFFLSLSVFFCLCRSIVLIHALCRCPLAKGMDEFPSGSDESRTVAVHDRSTRHKASS